ncbi:MAG: peptidase M14 [Planctomycetes bacterium]|nr:peptidase M14 [Planctomycetota bacterium]
MKHVLRKTLSFVATLAILGQAPLPAQRNDEPKLAIQWNRFYDADELVVLMNRMRDAWPRFVTMRSLGKSWEGRELWMIVVNNPATGEHHSKPAMYTDANIHGNEVQGGEANLYLVWYLMENYGKVARITELVDRAAFYVVPTVNVDGRAAWFREANNASSQRAPRKPFDDDRDGLLDEDGPNDLDGDGHLTQMRKRVPPGEGDWRESETQPGLLERVPQGQKGDFLLLGSEGIDDDGDGRINEDGPGFYDMNRNWPSGWNPSYLQGGAGEYPLSHPETRAIADFILAHRNIAGVQAFHNAGGMILRGPGVAEYGEYPSPDVAVYDALGRDGEFMLPFYRYMVIHKDLYSVSGGFVNWTYEGLGIFSFTNEMWSDARLMQKQDARLSETDRARWNDLLLFGDGRTPWTKVQHPLYGEIEVGGSRKFIGRTPPSWLIEEELHRNAAFVAHHAWHMPLVTLEDLVVRPAPGGLHYVDVTVRNHRKLPTRSALAAARAIGIPDTLRFEGAGLSVVAGGEPTDRFRLERITLQERDPATLRAERGVPGEGEWRARWIVSGTGRFSIHYRAEKAKAATLEGAID